MNCSVCGGPLLFSRVAFRCSCGAYIHAYCLDKHILLAHRPEFEEGTVDLNGDFHPMSQKVETVPPAESGGAEGPVTAEEAGAEMELGEAVEEEEEGQEQEDEEKVEEIAARESGEPSVEESGFVEVDTVAEEEKLDSEDTEEHKEE